LQQDVVRKFSKVYIVGVFDQYYSRPESPPASVDAFKLQAYAAKPVKLSASGRFLPVTKRQESAKGVSIRRLGAQQRFSHAAASYGHRGSTRWKTTVRLMIG